VLSTENIYISHENREKTFSVFGFLGNKQLLEFKIKSSFSRFNGLSKMNADILKRVIRAIAEESQDDLGRLARKIVDIERTSGHTKLADQLDTILKQSKPYKHTTFPDNANRVLRELPISRRNGELLVTFCSHDTLEHNMVLPDEVETKFIRIESEFAARERLGAYGLKPRKTILLYGPSGCGKSLGAKRLAWNTGLPLLKVRFDALLSSFFGESAANLRSVFDAAKERPCILVLDECDFIARSRTNTKDIGEASRIVNALLLLMEEYDAPGLLVATTNIESALDDALFRRFDDSFLIPPPGMEEIERLLKLTLSAIQVADSVNWKDIVHALNGHSAAQVVKTAQDAAKTAFLAGKKIVENIHFGTALRDIHIIKSSH
jgi:SpoVK/Ycf46/Vps4 family AAA+-type ATPase